MSRQQEDWGEVGASTPGREPLKERRGQGEAQRLLVLGKEEQWARRGRGCLLGSTKLCGTGRPRPGPFPHPYSGLDPKPLAALTCVSVTWPECSMAWHSLGQ